MEQQQKPPGLRHKLSSYFRMLCGRPIDLPKPEPEEPLTHRPTLKRKRLTFLLDRALVKLSRRNISLQEFSAKQQVQEEVEKHLSYRLEGIVLAVFVGPFGEAAIKNICFPISLLPSPPPHCEYITSNNQILTNQPFPLRKMAKGVEAYVQWVEGGRAGIAIQSVLLSFHSFAEHFVFICQGEPQLSDLHELFVLYREDYMFEVQRIMLLERCLKHIVYVSRSEAFLCIDRGSLIEFFVEEAVRRENALPRVDFACLIDRLFEAGYYVEAASVMGDLLATKDELMDFGKEFSRLMQERYSYSHTIVRRATEARNRMKTASEESKPQPVPKFYENTPVFGQNEHSSIQGNMSESGSAMTRNHLGVSFGKAVSYGKIGTWQT